MTADRRLTDRGVGALVAAVNHLLRQNDWARAELASFAGRCVRIEVDAPALAGLPVPRLLARVGEGGVLEPLPRAGESSDEIAVRMVVRPSVDAAFGLLRDGPRTLRSHLHIEGDATFAAALGAIVEHLRWDPEEDLSRITGDAVAHRIGRGIESVRAAAHDLRSRLEGSAVGYLAGDGGQLVGRAELGALRASLDALERRLDRLDAAHATASPHPTVR